MLGCGPAGPGYTAVWPTKGQINFAHLDSRGDFVNDGEIPTPGRSGMRTGMLALNGPAGSTLVVWKHHDSLGWQRYDSEGRPREAAGSASSAGQGAAGVVGADGRFILFR